MLVKIKEIAKDKPVICVGDLNSTPETEQTATLENILNDAYKVTEIPLTSRKGLPAVLGTTLPASAGWIRSLWRRCAEGLKKMQIIQHPHAPEAGELIISLSAIR